MAFIKEVSGEYRNAGDLLNLTEYVVDAEKSHTDFLIGGLNVLLDGGNVGLIFDQMSTIQKHRRFSRRAYHIIVAFDPVLESHVKPQTAYYIGEKICWLYREYQSFFYVHEDHEYLHLHLIINNLPIYPTKKNLSEHLDLRRIHTLVEDIVEDRR